MGNAYLESLKYVLHKLSGSFKAVFSVFLFIYTKNPKYVNGAVGLWNILSRKTLEMYIIKGVRLFYFLLFETSVHFKEDFVGVGQFHHMGSGQRKMHLCVCSASQGLGNRNIRNWACWIPNLSNWQTLG